MKKISLFISLILIAIALVACDLNTTTTLTANPTTATSTTESLDRKYVSSVNAYLLDQIPLELKDDYVLPILDDFDGVDISWEASESEIHAGKWKYLEKDSDYILVLTATITYKGKAYEYKYELSVKTLSLNTAEGKIAYAVKFLDENIPEETYKNIKLIFPEILEYVELDFTSTRSTINHDLWIYTFPKNSYSFKINCTIKCEDKLKEYSKQVIALSKENISELPILYINTVNSEQVTSKEDYVKATCTIKDKNITLLEDEALGIRIRGNSTSTFEKKPYRIKFDSKVSLFGEAKNKSWVLLANYTDLSLMRNYMALSFGSQLSNLEWTPCAHFVEVYLNNQYLGSYLLSEQVEVKKGRVDIESESSDVDTGYLVELDNKVFEGNEGNLGWDWFSAYDNPYVIKSPETDEDYYNIDQFNYIKKYIIDTEDALYRASKNITTGKLYTEYIDKNSLIDFYLVQELMKNVDAGYSSCFMYKDKGTLLKMGPLWDFDLSSGNQGHDAQNLIGPTGWYVNTYKSRWFTYLMQNNDFYQSFKERYNEVYEEIILPTIESIYDVYDEIYYSAYKNFDRWTLIGNPTGLWYEASDIVSLESYDEQVFYLYDYLMERSEWLYNELNKA